MLRYMISLNIQRGFARWVHFIDEETDGQGSNVHGVTELGVAV